MYAEAEASLEALHIGGDEVPAGVWAESPACHRRMAQAGIADRTGLQDDFIRRILDILHRQGLSPACWEEIALIGGLLGHAGGPEGDHAPEPNPAFVASGLRSYVWNAVWGWGREDVAYRLANAGYPIVLCNSPHLYLDLAYCNDPNEPGQEWSGFVSARNAFDFCPLDIFAMAERDVRGALLDPAMIAGKTRLTAEGGRNVLGIQAELWGEHTIDRGRFEYFLLPRLIAVAERAWVRDPGYERIADPAERRHLLATDWAEFANRLGQVELPRLDGFLGGFGYRIPLPGARIAGGMLHANIETPGLAIRYTVDGSDPDINAPLFDEPRPVPEGATVRLAAFTRRGRRGRVVTV